MPEPADARGRLRAMTSTVEVLPDVSGLDRTFAYEVPEELAGAVTPGCIVRVVLHGRRVRGWVVAELRRAPPRARAPSPERRRVARATSGARRPLPVGRLALRGTPAAVAGGGVASPARAGSPGPAGPAGTPATPAPPPRTGTPATTAKAGSLLEDEIAAATAQALSCPSAVLRLPPAAPRLAVVAAGLRALGGDKDLLVLAASRHDALIVASRLERAGHPVALQPDAWAGAAAGGRVVVGTRSAVLAPVAGLGAIVVLDAHADSYQEERVPTWEATVLAEERARRAGAPCLLVSACPSVDLVTGRPLITLSRESERAGWAPIEVLDARDEDPRAGGYPAPAGGGDQAGGERGAASAPSSSCSTGRAGPACSPAGGAGACCAARCAGAPSSSSSGRRRGRRRCSTARGAPWTSRPGAPPAGRRGPSSCGPASPAPARTWRLSPGSRWPRSGVRGRRPTPWRRPRSSSGPRPCCTAPAPASVVVFLDFDNELLAPRYRAGEQALALLALASRLVGGRRRSGRVVARTRSPDHEVLRRRPARRPRSPRRRRAAAPGPAPPPPATALALVSGDGAAELVSRLSPVPGSLEVGSAAAGRFLIRAAGPEELAEALAAAGPAPAGTRIEVAPRQV